MSGLMTGMLLKWIDPCREIQAANARRCFQTIHEINPKAEVIVWSDMFDPHHNARDKYYLVQGTLAGSWEGLPASVVIMNWNSGKAAKSLSWFAGRKHRQIIAGYYDGAVQTNVTRWQKSATKIDGIVGYMYTTWRRRYDELEAFATAVGQRHRP